MQRLTTSPPSPSPPPPPFSLSLPLFGCARGRWWCRCFGRRRWGLHPTPTPVINFKVLGQLTGSGFARHFKGSLCLCLTQSSAFGSLFLHHFFASARLLVSAAQGLVFLGPLSVTLHNARSAVLCQVFTGHTMATPVSFNLFLT